MSDEHVFEETPEEHYSDSTATENFNQPEARFLDADKKLKAPDAGTTIHYKLKTVPEDGVLPRGVVPVWKSDVDTVIVHPSEDGKECDVEITKDAITGTTVVISFSVAHPEGKTITGHVSFVVGAELGPPITGLSADQTA